MPQPALPRPGRPTVVAPAPPPAGAPAPRVSVIVPCYNYGHFLPAAIASALGQAGVVPEVIVVDDASTDDSASIAEKAASADPRVRLIRHTANTGHVVAFNDGLAAATGEFIVRLDADDMLTPGSLERATALLRAYPRVGLVYGHPHHFTAEPPPPEQIRTHVRGWRLWSGRDWIERRCRRGHNCITTPEAMVRASVIAEIGPLSTRLKFAQDMEYWLRVAAVADVGRVDGPDQALHRDHAASMSATTGSGLLLDLDERRTVFATLFDGPGRRLPDAADLHRLARRSLAAEALQDASHCYDRGLTGTRDVQSFVDFAVETYPQARELPQWRALQRRRRIGARWSPLVPPFVASVVWRRLRRDLRYRAWVRQGV